MHSIRRGASRSTLAIAILLACLIGVALPAAPAGSQPGPGVPPVAPGEVVTRAAGPGRAETAVELSKAGWDTADDVVLATGGSYPDALAAGALAARLDAPILLAGGDALPAVVAAELTRLAPRRAWLLGGEQALGAGVEADLVARGLEVRRIAGPDRFRTAVAAATEAGLADAAEVLVALGGHTDPAKAWPDALSAGAFAALEPPLPLVLATGEDLPDPTADALRARSSPPAVMLVGGTAALGEPVAAELRSLGADPGRLAGADRFATSAAVAGTVLERLAPADAQVPLVLASGSDFPDGLAAAALAARLGGVLLLVPAGALADSAASVAFITEHADRFSSAVLAGGTAAVSERVRTDVAAVLGPAEEPEPEPSPSPTPAPSPSPDAPTPPDFDLPLEPNPLDVAVTVEDGAAQRATISPEAGATLEATGADGTRYRLEVPAGAVAEATEITLTPVATIDGHPFEEVVAGADFGPDGLQLQAPATLTMTPASAVDEQDFTGFGYLADGTDLHLYPVEAGDDGELTASITHFSGAGAAEATPAQRDAAHARTPADAAAQLSAEVAHVLDRARRGEISPAEVAAHLEALTLAWYDEVVEPQLQAAQSGSPLYGVRDAANTYLSWEQMPAIVGIGDPAPEGVVSRSEEGRNLVESAQRASVVEAHRRCTAGLDQQAFRWLLGTGRHRALFGDENGSQEAFELASKCLRSSGEILVTYDTTSPWGYSNLEIDASFGERYDVLNPEQGEGEGEGEGDGEVVIGSYRWAETVRDDRSYYDCTNSTKIDGAGEHDLTEDMLFVYPELGEYTVSVIFYGEHVDFRQWCPNNYSENIYDRDLPVTARCPRNETSMPMRKVEERRGEDDEVIAEVWDLTCSDTEVLQDPDGEITQEYEVVGTLVLPPGYVETGGPPPVCKAREGASCRSSSR